MKRPLLPAALLAVVAALLFSACGGSGSTSSDASGSAPGGEPLIIGAPMPLTGPYAADGALSKEGLDFAVDDVNAAGGILGRQVKVEYFDVQDMAPERVILAADTLVGQKKADVIIAGWVGAGGDVVAFGKYPLPYFENDGSQAAIDTIKQGGYTNAFQWQDGEPANARDLWEFSQWLPYEYPNKKLMVVGADDDFCRKMTGYFADQAQADGWEVVGREVVPYGTTDWGPLMSKITKEKPSLLYFEVPSPPDMLTFLRKFKQSPTNTIISFGYGLQMRDFLKAAGSEANGIIGLGPGMVPPMPAATAEQKAWYDRFEAKYGNWIAGVGAPCYASLMIWKDAVESVGDPTKYAEINEYISTVAHEEPIPGWGPIKFEDGYVHLDTIGANDGQLQDGRLVTLYRLGKGYTDYQGNTTSFQVPDWIK